MHTPEYAFFVFLFRQSKIEACGIDIIKRLCLQKVTIWKSLRNGIFIKRNNIFSIFSRENELSRPVFKTICFNLDMYMCGSTRILSRIHGRKTVFSHVIGPHIDTKSRLTCLIIRFFSFPFGMIHPTCMSTPHFYSSIFE